MHGISRSAVYAVLGAVGIVSPLSAQNNLVANGSFESDTDGSGKLDQWATSGVAGMEQTLTIDTDSDGTRAARLPRRHRNASAKQWQPLSDLSAPKSARRA